MKDQQGLFAAFSPASKEAWLRKLEKDLRGRPVEELDWQLEEQIRLAPFYTAEDLPEPAEPIGAGRSSNTWQIGEYHQVRDMGEANAAVLEGLNGGVNAPLFQFYRLPSMDELKVLLEGIEPSFITVHFAPHHPGKDPAELFKNLIYYVRRKGFDLASIAGSVDFDPFLDWTDPPFKPLARIIRFAARRTPLFKVLQVNGRTFHAGPENTSRELALIIAKGATYLSSLNEMGVAPAMTNAHLQFSVTLSTSYFVEIAKLRALRVLWANVLDAYGLAEEALPPIATHLAPESQTDDPNSNMIRATTQAMAAAIGGANVIFIRPANYKLRQPATSFTRRMARNVQHLLQMEGHLDRVVDPAAGSYYIEQLTKALAEQAWQHFQEIEAQGGFGKMG